MNGGLAGGSEGQTPVHADDLEGLLPRWVRTQGQLDEVERENLLEGRRWAMARRRSLSDVLDDAFLRELHCRSFGKVWEWAGTYRRRSTSIGMEGTGIPTATRELMRDAQQWLRTASSPAEVERELALLHHRLIAIHPFLNGNGRTARLFVDAAAVSIGHRAPSWGAGLPAARVGYLVALRAADAGDLAPLTAFMWS